MFVMFLTAFMSYHQCYGMLSTTYVCGSLNLFKTRPFLHKLYMYEFFLLSHYWTNFKFFCGYIVFSLTFFKLIGKLSSGFWHLYKLVCCLNNIITQPSLCTILLLVCCAIPPLDKIENKSCHLVRALFTFKLAVVWEFFDCISMILICCKFSNEKYVLPYRKHKQVNLIVALPLWRGKKCELP